MLLRIGIGLLGLGFLLVGVTGLFRPEQLSEALALTPSNPVGLGSLRAMIGAHYFAMGSVALLAALLQRWSWLVPLAAIEGCMVLARGLAATAGQLDEAGISATIMEVVACLVLSLGAYLPGRTKMPQAQVSPALKND